MDAVYVSGNQDMIAYTPGSAVAAGDVVELAAGGLVGIALQAIAASEKGSLAVSGVFDVVKEVLSTSAIAVGAKVYWDQASGAVNTDGAETFIGFAAAAATAAATTVRVYLNP